MYSEAHLEAVPDEVRLRVQRLQREREAYRRQLAAVNAALNASDLTAAQRQSLRKEWSNLMLAIKTCGTIIGEVFASYAKREAMHRREVPLDPEPSPSDVPGGGLRP